METFFTDGGGGRKIITADFFLKSDDNCRCGDTVAHHATEKIRDLKLAVHLALSYLVRDTVNISD